MNTTGAIRLSTNEFVSGLALSGYSELASQVINDLQLIKNEKEVERFVKQTEQLLRQKGYLDDTRESSLVSGLENLIHLLVQSRKKVRCVDMKKKQVLFFHHIHQSKTLIQHVKGNDHYFSFHDTESGFFQMLCNYYGVSGDMETNSVEPIEVTDQLFDGLHQTDSEVLMQMVRDQNLPATMRLFVNDFLGHGQELSNISFLESHYTKDESVIDQVVFLLPSESFIWHIDYEKVEQHQIFFVPVSVHEYFSKIDETVRGFFHLS